MSLPPENRPEPDSVVPPEGPLAPGSGLPINVAGGLASLFTLPSGLFFFFMDRRDPFVRFYAVQGMVIGAIGSVMYIVHALVVFILDKLWILGQILLPIFDFVTAIISMVLLIIWVISTICAFGGRMWRVPYLSAALKRYVSRLP